MFIVTNLTVYITKCEVWFRSSGTIIVHVLRKRIYSRVITVEPAYRHDKTFFKNIGKLRYTSLCDVLCYRHVIRYFINKGAEVLKKWHTLLITSYSFETGRGKEWDAQCRSESIYIWEIPTHPQKKQCNWNNKVRARECFIGLSSIIRRDTYKNRYVQYGMHLCGC
jgi:hypothetical protein